MLQAKSKSTQMAIRDLVPSDWNLIADHDLDNFVRQHLQSLPRQLEWEPNNQLFEALPAFELKDLLSRESESISIRRRFVSDLEMLFGAYFHRREAIVGKARIEALANDLRQLVQQSIELFGVIQIRMEKLSTIVSGNEDLKNDPAAYTKETRGQWESFAKNDSQFRKLGTEFRTLVERLISKIG